jgi:hypothetical protein
VLGRFGQLSVLLRSATDAKPDAKPDAEPNATASRRHAVSDLEPDAKPDAKPDTVSHAIGSAGHVWMRQPTVWLQLLGLHRDAQSRWVLQLRYWLWLF